MKFDAFTGTLYVNDTHHVRKPNQALFIVVSKEHADRIGEGNGWYPLYDWCDRYIGAVLDGQFQDVENIRKRWNYHEHKW